MATSPQGAWLPSSSGALSEACWGLSMRRRQSCHRGQASMGQGKLASACLASSSSCPGVAWPWLAAARAAGADAFCCADPTLLAPGLLTLPRQCWATLARATKAPSKLVPSTGAKSKCVEESLGRLSDSSSKQASKRPPCDVPGFCSQKRQVLLLPPARRHTTVEHTGSRGISAIFLRDIGCSMPRQD